MTRPRDYEQNQARPRDNSDRAAGTSVDDPASQPAQSPSGPEEGADDLRVVDADEVGAGRGLDEAELARTDPLDGKPWDGDDTEPLRSAPAADQDYPAQQQDFDADEEEES
ncbi:hypothetical protein ACXYTJ_06735 [Gilvimarinus sp. F26214L]|uniref:hypothetical protein n=1 Tax=Gilvimarinus sp. DZF01 TaxID=3461371 RepID=UPI004045DBCF